MFSTLIIGKEMARKAGLAALVLTVALALGSCSLLRSAGKAEEVFMSEEDSLIAEDSFPLLIKTTEILLAGKPGDRDAIVAHASLLVMYASAFVQGNADLLPDSKYEEKAAAQSRAAALYLRAGRLLEPALARRKGALAAADVPLMYWTAASMLGRFSINPLDIDNANRLPVAIDLLLKAEAITPGWNKGSVEELLVSLYAGLPDYLGGGREKAEAAWEKAFAYSKGGSASLYVSRARNLALPANDYAGFKKYLELALAVDSSSDPRSRLATELAKKQARWLLASANDLFIDLPEGVTP